MAIAFVKNGGVNGSKAAVASLAITVPAGGHAVGNTVIVFCGDDGSATQNLSIADSKGNTWVDLHDVGTGGSSRRYMWGSVLTTALVAGDTITVTASTSTMAISGITSAEFSGVSLTEDIASTAAAGSSATSPSIGPVTPPSAAVLILCPLWLLGPTSDTFTQDTDTNGGSWASGPVGGTTGGSATSNGTTRLAYKITTSSVAQTYNPTLGTLRRWDVFFVALQPTAVAGQNFTLTPATETDASQALSITKKVTLTPAVETDTALPLSPQRIALSPATEVDGAQALSVTKVVTLTPATFVNAAQPLSSFKSLTLSPSTETDAAQPLIKAKTLVPSVESDVAQALLLGKAVAVAPATSVDTAQALTPIKSLPVTPSTEADAANPLTPTKIVSLAPATETDTAQAITFTQGGPPITTVTLTPATETDAAVAFLPFRIVTIAPAVSPNTAQPLSVTKSLPIAPATSPSTAQPLSFNKSVTLPPSSEADAPLPIVPFKTLAIVPAVETDTTQPLIATRRVTILPSTEIDLAAGLTFGHIGGTNFVNLTPALETDVASALVARKVLLIPYATETDLSLPMVYVVSTATPGPDGKILPWTCPNCGFDNTLVSDLNRTELVPPSISGGVVMRQPGLVRSACLNCGFVMEQRVFRKEPKT